MIRINKYLAVEKTIEENPTGIGTCLQGEIEITYKDIVKVFGKPTIDYGNESYKVQCEWVVMTPCGIATLYDYKQGKAYNGNEDGIAKTKVLDWHIGGVNETVVGYVVGALLIN